MRVFCVCIVIVAVMFVVPCDSYAVKRWENGKYFSSLGLSMGYESIEHQHQLFSFAYNGNVVEEGSFSAISVKPGIVFSDRTAIYTSVLISTLVEDKYLGIGMMRRLSRNGASFVFGDVGVVSAGGSYGMSGGIGFDFSHFTLDFSALIAGGDSGRTYAGMATLSYLIKVPRSLF